jgi:hypothetical protein
VKSPDERRNRIIVIGFVTLLLGLMAAYVLLAWWSS